MYHGHWNTHDIWIPDDSGDPDPPPVDTYTGDNSDTDTGDNPDAATDATSGRADTDAPAGLSWTFHNRAGTDAQIKFFSNTRDHVWPGNDQVWNLNRGGDSAFN